MKFLSIAINWHDASICYYDGSKLEYLKPERFIQIKHYRVTTKEEFEKWIGVWNITLDDVDEIAICNVPHPNSIPENSVLINSWKEILKRDNITILDHHLTHALSTQLFSDKDFDVAITLDGEGRKNTWQVYRDGQLVVEGDVEKCGSIGHGVITIAEKLGIKGHNVDLAGKLMGLQSYGKLDEGYLEILRQFDINNVGATVHRVGFGPTTYSSGDTVFSFERYQEYRKDTNLLDWAHTVHHRCGEIILDFFRSYAKPTDTISYSGGVAQNVIWNTLLKKEFPNLVVLPHCGDEGLSFGGMEYLRQKHNLPRIKVDNFPFIQMDESTDEIQDDTIEQVAKLLAEGKVVAYYQGRGEVGPRALGNRSILFDPRIPNGKDIINTIKNRESYRPFGASVLSQFAKEYFDLDFENPYMLYVGVTQKDNLKSITHVDGTCRAQTVSEGHFFKLLTKFYEITGCPVLLNTSLNNSGKPIAGHIKNAVEEFATKNIDALVVGNKIYHK
jgi:carbamoyltransferase